MGDRSRNGFSLRIPTWLFICQPPRRTFSTTQEPLEESDSIADVDQALDKAVKRGRKKGAKEKSKQRLTPAMAQFMQVKKQYPGYLLLFRIGDFYETFYEDAVLASQVLGIALTRRDKTSNIPMAGIPHHAYVQFDGGGAATQELSLAQIRLDTYLEKLIKQGVVVAICDQVESVEEAKKRRHIVKREVTRLVTPGTITEERFLPPREHNYLAASEAHRSRLL